MTDVLVVADCWNAEPEAEAVILRAVVVEYAPHDLDVVSYAGDDAFVPHLLRLLEEGEVDLALLDLNLGQEHGIDVLAVAAIPLAAAFAHRIKGGRIRVGGFERVDAKYAWVAVGDGTRDRGVVELEQQLVAERRRFHRGEVARAGIDADHVDRLARGEAVGALAGVLKLRTVDPGERWGGAAMAPLFVAQGVDKNAIVMVSLGIPMMVGFALIAARVFAARAGQPGSEKSDQEKPETQNA